MRQQRSGRNIDVSSVPVFLPATYRGLYAASKHAIVGLSETLAHEVRGVGVRVVLVEPSNTRTNLDLNAPQAAAPIAAHDADRTIVDAALAPWQMRRTPQGAASLLRKTFGLS